MARAGLGKPRRRSAKVIECAVNREAGVRYLRVFATFLLLVAAVPAISRADENPSPEALQAANKLFSVLSHDLIKQITTQMDNLIWPLLEQKARADKIDDATIAELRPEFERNQVKNLAEIMKDAPPIYARHFTSDELNQIVAFYKSPVGTRAMRELPRIRRHHHAAAA